MVRVNSSCFVTTDKSYLSSLLYCRYSGRGLFLDPPTVYVKNNTCNLSLPKIMKDELSSGDTCQ
jgi:bifunctional dethiobiotin synthetase / adenosylmethionine---8-amino-7-oxononanoate aminotransferase